MVRQSATSSSMLVHEIRKIEMSQRQLGEEANRALDLLHKEVASHRIGSQDATEAIAKLLLEIKDMQAVSSVPENIEIKDKSSLKEEIARLNSQETNIAAIEEKLENVQRSLDKLGMCFPSGKETPDLRSSAKKKKVLPFALSNSPNMPNIIRSPCSPAEPGIENRAPESNNNSSGSDAFYVRGCTPRSNEEDNIISSAEATPASKHSNSVDVKKMQKMFKKATEENIRSIRTYVTGLKERVAKLQYQKQLLVCQVKNH